MRPKPPPGVLHLDPRELYHTAMGAALGFSPANITRAVREFWDLIGPGGRLHPAGFIEHKGHLVLEGLLVVIISYLLIQRTYKPSSKEAEPLTEKEIDQLCEEWEPEPLYRPPTSTEADYEPPVISSTMGTYVVANGKRVLNMVSFNFLGVAGNDEIMKQCRTTINKYGVGSCGPRGFYGTIDVHLDLEEKLARFMGTEETILYSYDLATVPSILPAFANAKDLIICDAGVSYPIQNGCHLSRAEIRYFKHNDMADLERVLQAVAQHDLHSKKPLNRRFIVVEGIYNQYGDLAPLDVIYELKRRYKYRLVVDESLSLGVLGSQGQGACEYFGLKPGDAEIVSASLGNALASVGGFCAGEREIVDHQRLSGLGYCFSASLPPYLATAAIGALDFLQGPGAGLLPKVTGNAKLMRYLLQDMPGMRLHGGERDEVSPVIHVHLDPQPAKEEDAVSLLQQVVEDALKRESVLYTVNRVSPLDKVKVAPSIRIAVSALHEERDIQKAATALRHAVKRALNIPLKSPERLPVGRH
ncbi:hypothetical protein WJX72_001902 [[Myrmecia] bisecta]|uniref:serine C-palmitoyltransferase n=1 Tax=[Myrmecia] bisecta TaxID=41462 RepID=A0AAW1PCJ1_9CHLO